MKGFSVYVENRTELNNNDMQNIIPATRHLCYKHNEITSVNDISFFKCSNLLFGNSIRLEIGSKTALKLCEIKGVGGRLVFY